MDKLQIICIDDQREVLATLKKDLAYFKPVAEIILCESATEADEVLEELDAEGQPIALLICDHIMPGENGVDFLSRINRDERFLNVRKLLLTGLATQQDTIEAINRAHIDHYIAKPWSKEDLLSSVKTLITRFILRSDLDYESYMTFMDHEILYKELRRRT